MQGRGRRAWAPALVAALALVLAGCAGGSGGGQSDADGSSASTRTDPTADEVAPPYALLGSPGWTLH